MSFQESSSVLATPDIILLTKAAAGKSKQELGRTKFFHN